LEELQDPGSRGFEVETDQGSLALFLVRRGESGFAYLNQCPHTGINLEWLPDQFLDTSGGLIQCATHGALFRIEDGYCLRGPCAGESLKPLRLEQEGGELVLVLE
jgi:nitrite reductase/ring-hydroxylating ferredoxin subunit